MHCTTVPRIGEQPARRVLEGPQHPGLVLGVEVLQVRLGLEQAAAADQDGHLPAARPRGRGGGKRSTSRRIARTRPIPGRGFRPSVRPRRAVEDSELPDPHRGLARTPQVLGEIRRGRVAVLQPLRQRPEAGLLQFGRDLAAELTRGLRLVVAHLAEQLADGARPERQVAAEQLVEHHAQAVDVGAAVDPVRRARRPARSAMYAGVPEMTPSSEPPALASSRPRPKSTRTGPRSGEDDVPGLTSRWTISRAWAWARASATAAAIRAASGQAGR